MEIESLKVNFNNFISIWQNVTISFNFKVDSQQSKVCPDFKFWYSKYFNLEKRLSKKKKKKNALMVTKVNFEGLF